MTGSCPRCKAPITSTPDEQGFFPCPQCGVRLKVQAPAPATPLVAAPSAPGPVFGWEALQGDLQALRAGQQQILVSLAMVLKVLRAGAPPSTSEAAWGLDAPSRDSRVEDSVPTAPPRTRRRQKSVLLVDDDPETREAAVAALGQAQVPVEAVADGNSALAAIAAEKPDVLVLELDIAGAMSGRDVINMIKATMEWVDIPILFYTRLPIKDQKEARQIHGGDEYVAKGPGSAEALVARVIAVFQRA